MLDFARCIYGGRYLCRSVRCQIQGKVKNPIGGFHVFPCGFNVKCHGDHSEIMKSRIGETQTFTANEIGLLSYKHY